MIFQLELNIYFLFLILISSQELLTLAHVFDIGECPEILPKEGFEISRFEGAWYVVEKFAAVSKCVRETVTRSEHGDGYKIQAEMDSLGVPLIEAARVEFFSGLPKSIMRINFAQKYNLDPQNYWVLDTDYQNWAVVWSCEEGLVFGHKESAQIMSRLPTLETATRDRIKKALSKLGVNTSYFTSVDHSNCLWDLNGKMKALTARTDKNKNA